jgi:hypothetical protein
MNHRSFLCLVFLLTVFSGLFAQESTADFIRDYTAPDFKLRRFSVAGSGNGAGTVSDNTNTHQYGFAGSLYYYQISNQKNYQGIISTALFEDFGFGMNGSQSILGNNLLISNTLINRFYFRERWFVGVHDDSRIGQSFLNYSSDSIPDISNSGFAIRPAVSIGYGRVEWVQFARQAMDIEGLLSSCNRLSPSFSHENRTDLANRIAQVSNRRYYDTRFGIIDQLQSLDSLLSAEAMITNSDIVYFSHLQDAFLYSRFTTRLSGFRHEFGVAQSVELGNQSNNVGLTTYGFYNFNYFLPQSYAVQHNFEISVIGGRRGSTFSSASDFPLWTDLQYTFGWYPTTRTYLGVTGLGGVNLDNGIGYIYGAIIDAYFWVSPKLRLAVQGRLHDGFNYRTHNFSHVAVSNPDRNLKVFDYSLRLNLTYEIF